MEVKKMSYLNPDELKENEVDYIQDLYKLQIVYLERSITYIFELANHDSIIPTPPSKEVIKLSDLIYKSIENNSNDIREFRQLIMNGVFTHFYDIIKPTTTEEKHNSHDYKKIIITDLYTFIPLIRQLIKFYSNIASVIYNACNIYINQITIDNNNVATNNIIVNAIIDNYFSIELLYKLLNFIETRKIHKYLFENNINDKVLQIEQINTIDSSNFQNYLLKIKEIVSLLNNGSILQKINMQEYVIYLKTYIDANNRNIIIANDIDIIKIFIKDIQTFLISYITIVFNKHLIPYDSDNFILLFDYICENIHKLNKNIQLIQLLNKIITLIENLNSKLNNSNNYDNILSGIYIIILLKKLIEYLHDNNFIITYDKNIERFESNAIQTPFMTYINTQIYPNIRFKLRQPVINITADISTFLDSSFKKSSSFKKRSSFKKSNSIIVTNSSNPETINIFIRMLGVYVLNYFYEVLNNVTDDNLKKILYEYDTNKKYIEITFIKNIISLFKIIEFKISNKKDINDSIKYLLQYISDLTIYICLILKVKSLIYCNKYILMGVVNIILLNKLKDYFELKTTTITYSYYDYSNITNDISMNDIMNFIIDNKLEYDLDSNIIEFSKIITENEIYDNIITIIIKINHQYDYSENNVSFVGQGGANKYKKTENKITVIYKKKEYTRVIYICERKKYIKLNKTYMLLSKLKKI